MPSDQPPIPQPPPPDQGGYFRWKGFLLALLAAPIFGVIWARAAATAQGYFAPLVLFPLLLGALAGLTIVGFVRMAQIGHRPTILLAAALTAAVAGAGEHYFSYLSYLSVYSQPRPAPGTSSMAGQDLSALVQKMAPGFGEYLQAQARHGRPLWAGHAAQGWAVWLSWAIDAGLVVAAAVAVTVPALRVPYCNRCGSWYRTVRSGRIDVLTARQLAEIAGVQEINHPRSARYRLSNCQGGCGPTRLELSWEERRGVVDVARLWLEPAMRNQITAVLDGVNETNDEGRMTNDE
jgi:hypothetical protein